MHIFLASDEAHMSENIWIIGVSSEDVPCIKNKLACVFNKQTILVDIVNKSSSAEAIFKRLKEECQPVFLEKDPLSENLFWAKGSHKTLGSLITRTSRIYERDHPSLSRNIMKWFSRVEC